MKKLYPNLYYKKVEEITIETLIKNKIKLLILDVDNTLIDYYKNLPEEVKQWAKEIAKTLQIPYKHFAMKPLKRGFKYIQKETNIKPENIAVVGDQIFTDVLGGNRCGMTTILVDPIDDKKDYWYTAWKRPIENKIKNKYITKEEKNKNVY